MFLGFQALEGTAFTPGWLLTKRLPRRLAEGLSINRLSLIDILLLILLFILGEDGDILQWFDAFLFNILVCTITLQFIAKVIINHQVDVL